MFLGAGYSPSPLLNQPQGTESKTNLILRLWLQRHLGLLPELCAHPSQLNKFRCGLTMGLGETSLEPATQHRVWDSLPNPFITVVENGAVRDELVERVLRSLSADGERGEGELLRRDVDRTYLRRNLTIAECGCVEKKLLAAGFRILDEESSDPDSISALSEQRNRNFLTEMEERELGRKIQLAKQVSANADSVLSDFDRRVLRDAERAKTRFVETNLLYVRKLAAQRRNLKHLTHDDVFQEGLIGLLRATELYDPELGFRFKTYATWWIQQHIHRALDDGDRTIRLPVHLHESIRRIRRKSTKLALELGREPSLAELAMSIGVEKESLGKLLWRLYATSPDATANSRCLVLPLPPTCPDIGTL
jgi:RNA polymerase sigma factor (sigma-70 family)